MVPAEGQATVMALYILRFPKLPNDKNHLRCMSKMQFRPLPGNSDSVSLNGLRFVDFFKGWFL